MSKAINQLTFENNGESILFNSEKDIIGIIDDWDSIRKLILKNPLPDFTRDELAYMVAFIEKKRNS